LSLYDVVFHFILTVFHILFEAAEWVLDHLVEHLFETGMRETQLIVFYTLMTIIGLILYGLYRQLPVWRDRLIEKIKQHIAETVSEWHSVSILGKIAWWSVSITMMSYWLFI
jgi:hypothetical protein